MTPASTLKRKSFHELYQRHDYHANPRVKSIAYSHLFDNIFAITFSDNWILVNFSLVELI